LSFFQICWIDYLPASSVSDDPVLHFVAFVPSSERRPLRLLDTLGQPTSFNSFVIPQWGGIIVVNPQTDEHTSSDHVLAAFHTFSSQLASLLGVHPLPDGIVNNDPNSFISDWQLDSLMRRRLLETSSATQETLSSIVKLVNQLENMPLGPDVKNSVQDSLNLINDVCIGVCYHDYGA
jgi:phosphatidylinositol glycan class S